MYKIMIVEDDPKIAELLQFHIQKYGDEGIIVRDFEHVLEQFKETGPHIVVLDINLPSFDGYYWCRQFAPSPHARSFSYPREAIKWIK